MFSSAVKVQNYRRLLQMHDTTPINLRNDALGLDLRAQRAKIVRDISNPDPEEEKEFWRDDDNTSLRG